VFPNLLISFDKRHMTHINWTSSSSRVSCVFVAAVTFYRTVAKQQKGGTHRLMEGIYKILPLIFFFFFDNPIYLQSVRIH
jgi:hypothetical protein